MDRVVKRVEEKRFSPMAGPFDEQLYSERGPEERAALLQAHSKLEERISKAAFVTGVDVASLRQVSASVIWENDQVNARAALSQSPPPSYEAMLDPPVPSYEEAMLDPPVYSESPGRPAATVADTAPEAFPSAASENSILAGDRQMERATAPVSPIPETAVRVPDPNLASEARRYHEARAVRIGEYDDASARRLALANRVRERGPRSR